MTALTVVMGVATAWMLAMIAAGPPGAADLRPETSPREPMTIIGGEFVEPGEFPEVVALLSANFTCTGTVVGPRLILTAAHCFDGGQYVVHIGDEVDAEAEAIAAQTGSHPDFVPIPLNQDIFDYGYLVTTTDLPPPYAVPLTSEDEWREVMQWGTDIEIVGFGVDPATGESGRKQKISLEINGFSDEGLEFYAGGDGRDSCRGDSGGPVFATLADGSRRLVGIISRGSDMCGKRGVYAVPHAGLCWVRDETGEDLTGQCPTCDCIDTTPPPKPPEGCGCTAEPGPAAPWLTLLGVLLWRRRRRTAAAAL